MHSNIKVYQKYKVTSIKVGLSLRGDADSSRAPGLASGLQGSVNVHRGALLLVPQWQCIGSFVFYIKLIE